MARTVPFLLAATMVWAGCLGAGAPAKVGEVDDVAEEGPPALPEPQLFPWSGHVIVSELEGPTHQRPTEDVLWEANFHEGILFDVQEVPHALEVSLEWTGGGQFMIMLHSHKATGTNVYVEHITPLDATNPKCLRVPTEDITSGHWQVMVHSRGVRNADFTLQVALFGGAGAIVMDERHGHRREDGQFQVDEHEIWPCGAADEASKGS